jgi:hypothetical protein
VTVLVVKVNLRPMRPTIGYSPAERTLSRAEQAPRAVNVLQEAVGTAFPNHFFRPVPGQVFRLAIPVCDPTFPIREVDATEKIIQHPFEEKVLFVPGLSLSKLHRRLHVFFPSPPAPTLMSYQQFF